MKTNQEFKNAALAALKGNWPQALICAVFMTFGTLLFMTPAYCSNMAIFGQQPFVAMNPVMLNVFSYSGFFTNLLLLYPLTLGYAIAHKDLAANGDARLLGNTLRHTFTGYLRNVWAMFLMYLFAILWSLLLIIPGIIKAFAYSMTPFILKDNPELSANKAINLSVRMMKGHKFDLFWLLLSFIGWFILCIFTFGVGFLWLMPYIQTSLAEFYMEVKSEYDKKINN